MRRLPSMWVRLLGLVKRTRAEEEFSAELESHLALHIEDGMRAGLSESEARRQAIIKLGGAEQARQSHRDGRGVLWLENLVQDLRYGLRTLRRSPGFTITALLTLGLGIGACTAIFSLVDAVLIRSLPYGDPERLVYLFSPNPNLKIPAEVLCPSYGDFYDIKRESRSYAAMSNFEQAMFNVGSTGIAQRMGAARVDEEFFRTLESMPEMGRPIRAEDIEPGHEKVAVISHALWASMFGGRADALNRTLELDGAAYRIIGVMPPEFEYPFRSDLPYGNSHIKSTHIWVPLALDAKKKSGRNPDDNVSIARLRPGVSIREAQAEMSAIMARLDKQYIGEMRDWGALVESFTGISIGPVRPLMRLLLVSVGLVLLIACGNAANLLLARAAARARELGVRAALGAGRSRMVRQLLTEALLIGVAGAVVGIALAFAFLRVLPQLDPGNIPRLNESSIDLRVLLFATGAALLTSVLMGLLPAFGAVRMELTEFLRTHAVQGRSVGHSRIQSLLIVGQTALVVVLLAGAGLLIRSYINVVNVDTGFSQATVTFHLALDDRYKPGPPEAAFSKQFIARLSALPGVQAVGAVNNLPLSNSESLTILWIDGYPNKEYQQSEGRMITPQYFSAMNIPLIAGRSLTDADTTGNRPTVVNKKFVETYFPNSDPIGRRVSSDEKHEHWSIVVGVVADVRHTSLEEEPQPQMYNAAYDFGDAYFTVRSTQPPSIVASEIRSVLKSIDPSLAVTDPQTMGDLISQASARRRFQTSLLTAFAGIALVLALVGLYGLMAYSVNRRTREVGIRMALGAQRRDVLLLVLKNAGLLVGAGLLAGLACTWIAARAIRSFLFGVSVHDPATIAAASALLMVCGLLAAFVPARRAASADPVQALRME
jgi:predicted permease